MKIKLNKTFQNQNDSNFFNMKTATKTFKYLLEKEYLQNKFKNNKHYLEKSERFFRILNKAFFKQEIKEKDQDYIYREIKRMQKYHQALIDSYGINSHKRVLETDPETIKYDKKLLFNPYKNENDKFNNNNIYRYNIFTKEKKSSNLPFILRQTNKMRLIKNNYNENKIFNKSNFSEKTEGNNISGYNSLNTESSSKNKRQYLTYNRNRNNFSKISGSSDGNQFNNIYYIETLDNLYEQTKESHKKQKKYFNSFDYGCTYNKNKCDYISKTLFNK